MSVSKKCQAELVEANINFFTIIIRRQAQADSSFASK